MYVLVVAKHARSIKVFVSTTGDMISHSRHLKRTFICRTGKNSPFFHPKALLAQIIHTKFYQTTYNKIIITVISLSALLGICSYLQHEAEMSNTAQVSKIIEFSSAMPSVREKLYNLKRVAIDIEIATWILIFPSPRSRPDQSRELPI
jgi:hypothetical protein